MKRDIKTIQENLNKRLLEANASLISKFSYKNNKSKFHLKCNKDGHEWNVTYYCFINMKNSCPRCAGQIVYENEANDEVEKRLKEINASLREYFKYNGSGTRLKLKCNIDGHEWETSYSNFVNAETGCRKCCRRILNEKEIKDNIEKRLKEINASLTKLYVHKNNKSKLKLKCNIDGNEWESTYYNFINSKKGCAKCARVLKLNQEEANKNVIRQCEKMNFSLLYPFIYFKTSNTIIHLKCKDCNNEWKVIYNNFISRESGCPFCNESRGERKISEILKNYKILHQREKTFENCLFKKKLKFDFYLPDYNTCIEYDGILHSKSFNFFGGENRLNDSKHRDKIKNDFCHENNIHLIRISYNEYNNIENIIKEKFS